MNKINKQKQLEKEEEEIDVRQIYLRNFKPHQPRVGKQYQAIIPECITAPKKKENNKIINEKIKPEKIENIIENKNKKENNQKAINKIDEMKIKNNIIGHKTYKDKNANELENEFIPGKKKKTLLH